MFSFFRTIRVWLKRDSGQYWPSVYHSLPSKCFNHLVQWLVCFKKKTTTTVFHPKYILNVQILLKHCFRQLCLLPSFLLNSQILRTRVSNCCQDTLFFFLLKLPVCSLSGDFLHLADITATLWQRLALHLLYWLKVCWWSTLQRCDRRYMFVKLLFDRFPSVVQLGGIYVLPSASSAAYNSNSSCWCVTDFRLLVIKTKTKKMLFKINCSRAAAKIAIKRIPVFLKTDFPE